MAEIWAVEPMWRGEVVVCIGGGPSLTQAQVDGCRGRARVIAINDAYRRAPWADILYFCDHRWWQWHRATSEFRAVTSARVTLDARVADADPGVRYVHNEGARKGLCLEPGHVFNGRNSGYQAINLAVQLGVARIVLLGYDMRAADGKTHWFGDHPTQTKPTIFGTTFLPWFETLSEQLDELGVEVVNATPGSALTAFPMTSLKDALRR